MTYKFSITENPGDPQLLSIPARLVQMTVLYLDLFNGVNNERVLQVLHGPFHPVIERGSPFGIFQVQLVNCFQ